MLLASAVHVPVPSCCCRLASAAQLAAVAALGWRFAAHLPTAWLLQTVAFVALNKVLRNWLQTPTIT